MPLMAALTAKLGDLEQAEEALSEAAIRAQESWGAALPDNPSGWLYRVALNAARDAQRRIKTRQEAAPLLDLDVTEAVHDRFEVSPESRMALFQKCADPILSQDQQIALMLFHLAGLDCAAIGRAFLVKEATIYQRLSRARAKLRAKTDQPVMSVDATAVRSALAVIYLQSYQNAAGGTEAHALGQDAIQLARALCEACPDDPENLAFLAYCLLLDSRRPARLSPTGQFVPLDQQTVALWAAAPMEEAAQAMLHVAAQGGAPRPYALRAQIEMTRMMALREGRSADADILTLMTALLDLTPDPFVAIERALVLARIDGAAAGLDALGDVEAAYDLSGHAGWHLAKADLFQAINDKAAAQLHLQAALTLTPGSAERAFIETTLARLMA
jgi:RNA polymerase sigma-70 factor (ECF subfamily)